MNPITWLRRHRAAAAARTRYYDVQKRIDHLTADLRAAADPRDRAVLLSSLARAQSDQADIYDRAWGPETDPDGTDAAQSQRWTSCLYRLLADVEQVAGYPGVAGRRVRMAAILGEPSDDILDRMARKLLLGDRMALLPDLASAVRHKVGERAAQAVILLPYPNGRLAARTADDRT